MKPYFFDIPEQDKIRVIISTDAKNEADDQYAITYALMSPKLDVVGIVAAHFRYSCTVHNNPWEGTDPDETMDRSYEEINTVLGKLHLTGKIPVLHGSARALADERSPRDSEGARFIIEQAHKPGRPLYVINIGTITDLASAYLLDPTIADGIERAVWLGGGAMPEGGPEFNLINDVHAGNVIMDSALTLSLLPVSATCVIKVGFAELCAKVRPCGEIGRYLYEEMIDFARKIKEPLGEQWILWDIAAVAVLLDGHSMQYREINAPRFGPNGRYEQVSREHMIRFYERIEPRYALEDLFAKLVLMAD